MILRELGKVVISEKIHLTIVIPEDTPEDTDTFAPHRIVVGPAGCQRGNRMIVGHQLRSQVIGVPDMQKPLTPVSDRYSAVPQRVTE